MATIIKQQISNHKMFTDIERFVEVKRIANNADVNQIVIEAEIQYIRDDEDVSMNFKTKIDNWIISNDYSVIQRDEQNAPVPNPEYPENSDEEYLMSPAFDYYHSLIIANEIPLLTLLSTSILNDDEKGAFDF